MQVKYFAEIFSLSLLSCTTVNSRLSGSANLKIHREQKIKKVNQNKYNQTKYGQKLKCNFTLFFENGCITFSLKSLKCDRL